MSGALSEAMCSSSRSPAFGLTGVNGTPAASAPTGGDGPAAAGGAAGGDAGLGGRLGEAGVAPGAADRRRHRGGRAGELLVAKRAVAEADRLLVGGVDQGRKQRGHARILPSDGAGCVHPAPRPEGASLARQETASLTLSTRPPPLLATTPVGVFGRPAASRSFSAICAISSGA